MTNVFDIIDWTHFAPFLAWTLVVGALAKAIFGSFPAAELAYRLSLREQPKRQRLVRLKWEIEHRARWDPDVARGSPHAAAVPLIDPELDARQAELRRLSQTSLPWRAVQYLLNCWACQTFWTAVLVYGLTARPLAPGAWFLSAAAYSGAAVLVSTLHDLAAGTHHAVRGGRRQTSCRG